MYVIATAGHVDHGKSTLIRALTGMEPDRWAEEQRRGMTIDLGFAWTDLGDGTTLAFVDVPGHQRFITNMLAGIGPVPAVLFVVAADQGWSAQSAEHLDALDALQVRHGVLAITRCDLGDAELAEEEAREYLAGSSLAHMEAVAVSSVTGTGLDELRAALSRLVGTLPANVVGRTRLWIDRVFSIRGAGTVVTGTLNSGVIRTGDELQVHPSGELVRVRAIESLKQQMDEVRGVSRVALNLRGVKPSALRRGDVLTLPGQWADVSIMDVRLSQTERLPADLILHLGSAAVAVRVRPLGADTARLTLAHPLPTSIGERAVLRDPGAQRLLAAVTVLDTMPPSLLRRGDARRRGQVLIENTGEPDLAGEIRRRGAVRRRDLILAGVQMDEILLGPRAVTVGDWLIDAHRWGQWRAQLSVVVDEWVRSHPLSPGMPRPAAVARLDLPDASILDALVREQIDLVLDSDGVHGRGHEVTLPPQIEHELARVVNRLDADPFDAPDAPELAAAGLTETFLAVAVRQGELIRVAAGVYLGPGAFEEAVRRLAELEQPFAVSDARQALNTTRRIALPLLEQLDRAHRTYRVDAQRRRVRT